MIEKIFLILVSILYASCESLQNGYIQCTNFNGRSVWEVYTSESDEKHGAWFLCDLTSPYGKHLCSCSAAWTMRENQMENATGQRYSLNSILLDKGCDIAFINERGWQERCIPEITVRRILQKVYLKAWVYGGGYPLISRRKRMRPQKLVAEFSQKIQNSNPNYMIAENIQQSLVLSRGNIQKLRLATNYTKFAVARDCLHNPQKVANDIVQKWGHVYGLNYSMATTRHVCFVTVWEGSVENVNSVTNDTVYDIVMKEISRYFQRSTCSDCRAFIQKEANQTMYCVSKVGCIPMAIGFESATNNSVNKIPQAWDVLKPHLNLYTKDSASNPIDVLQGNQSCYGTPQNSLFVIVHGFRSNGNKTWLLETKDALLSKNGTFLVILVDWNAGKLALTPKAYLQVAINSYAMGAILAYGLQKYLVKPSCIDPENVHFIGHSVGAHTVATAGSTFYSVSGKRIGKITGLDPAGPWFGDKDTTLRLDKSDAQHVEVLHTNGRNDNGTSALSPGNAVLKSKYGVRNPDGHIDFYVNGGVKQPKCEGILMCSHLRAHEYFTESIKTSCKFIGFQCVGNTTDEQVINCFHGNYTTSSRAVMGLHIPKIDHVGVYYVITTNDTSAFCDKEIDKKYPTP
ncbi:hypothetical protein FSP39_018271 [Pinctada imbricata]|uniref:Lipase domain-containing protein n=1 Tax=Pinctada imbricata TaxID=66713 RepID=A0AA88XRZ9_PINIB|nr:hypothetical protein FSP39_018271 [Pinctada imbricata]